MGNRSSSASSASSLVNYEAIQEQWISHPHPHSPSFAYPSIKSKPVLLIHVLSDPQLEQCLIRATIPSDKEEQVINQLVSKGETRNVSVIIYGKNTMDIPKCMKQRDKLLQLGFNHVFVYGGGMFEWLLLNEIYQSELFPLDYLQKGYKVDILAYKDPPSSFFAE